MQRRNSKKQTTHQTTRMKGIKTSPHYLQILILSFSSLYLLASSTSFVYEAQENCSYMESGHDDSNETNQQYQYYALETLSLQLSMD